MKKLARSQGSRIGATAAIGLSLCVVATPRATRADPLDLPSGGLTVSSDTVYEGGIIGTTGAPTLTINAGITATFTNGYTLLYGTGGRWNLLGSGTFRNLGTLAYSNALNVGLSWQSSSAIFINEGLFDFVGDSTNNNGGLYFYGAHPGQGEVINTNDGVVQASSGNTHNFGSNGGRMASYGGIIRVTNNSSLKLDQNEYYITNTTFESYGTGWIRLRRSPALVHGTAVGKALLLGPSSSFQVDAAGTVLDVDGLGVRFSGGNSWIASSGTFENRGLMTITGSGGDQSQIPRGGLLKNTGTLNHFNTSNVGIRPYSVGSRFENYGTWVCSNSFFYMDQVPGLTFSNMPGSVFRVIGSGESKFFNPNYSFHNEGTVEVLDGYIDFENSVKAISPDTMSDGVLKLGTWKCLGGNINFSFTTTDITTIDTDATVILSGTSWMDELDKNGDSLNTLYGTLGLREGKQYTNSAALTTSDTTTFEFGLDDSGDDPLFTIGGSTTLQCKIDVVDLGTLIPGRYRVIQMAPGETLTDGGILLGEVTTEERLLFRLIIGEGSGENGFVDVKVGSGAGGVINLR
ncbi:MAG: hypothetical protein HQ559_04415 [Lentisphaerae bacterium]|nr:hypothetical protein [Lentisphaerota bacterium]